MQERNNHYNYKNSPVVQHRFKSRSIKRLSIPELLDFPKTRKPQRSVTIPIIKHDKICVELPELKMTGALSPYSPGETNKYLTFSSSAEKLPVTLKKEIKNFRIKKRFARMSDFYKRIPIDDPLECYYEKLPYVDDVLKENRAKIYSKISKAIVPVFEEESNESYELVA